MVCVFASARLAAYFCSSANATVDAALAVRAVHRGAPRYPVSAAVPPFETATPRLAVRLLCP
jgi:hypothetical protein